ncbi:MAG: serine/threonine-protein kinase [Nannocystaceae bacterium]
MQLSDTELADRLLEHRLQARLFGAEAPPPELGGYRLERRLGAGGMGVVFRAHDVDLDRSVAIKVMHPDLVGAAAQLRQEARALGRLAHPNIVAVHEIGEHAGQLFVAMEFVEGCTLRAWMEQRRPLRAAQLPELLDVFTQAARGLEAAHAAGLVHRDFKPENVLVGADGRVRVVDFGIASTSAAAAAELVDTEPVGASARTLAGAIVGTPAYMAPEQLRGGAVDARADQFALCVALHEAIAGERPFPGRSLHTLAEAVCAGRPRPLPRWVPRRLRAVVARGLSKETGDRFASTSELVCALESALRPSPWRRVGLAGAALGVAFAGLHLAGVGEPVRVGGVVRWAAAQVPALCVRPPPAAENLSAYLEESKRLALALRRAVEGSPERAQLEAELAALQLARGPTATRCDATRSRLDEATTPRVEAELRCLLDRHCAIASPGTCPDGLVMRGVGGCQPESLRCDARGAGEAAACRDGSPACCLAADLHLAFEQRRLGGASDPALLAERLELTTAGCAQGFASLCLRAIEAGLDADEANRRACEFGAQAACDGRTEAEP